MFWLLWLAVVRSALALQTDRNNPRSTRSLLVAEDDDQTVADRAIFIAEEIALWRQSLERLAPKGGAEPIRPSDRHSDGQVALRASRRSDKQVVDQRKDLLEGLQEACNAARCLSHANCTRHIEDGMRQTFACVGAAIGLRRFNTCACHNGDAQACESATRVTSELGLEDFLNRNAAVAAALEAADVAAACADDEGPNEPRTRWLEGDTELPLTIAASAWMDAWMDKKLTSLKASDTEVDELSPTEMSLLAARIDEHLHEAGAVEAFREGTSEAITLAVLEEAVLKHLQQPVTPSCVKAYQACGQIARCQQLATSVWKLPPQEALQGLAQTCTEPTTLFAAMNVTSHCHSPLPAEEMQALSAEMQGVPVALLCEQAAALVREHAKNFLPMPATEAAEASSGIDLQSNGCAAARMQCDRDPRCKTTVEAMQRQHLSAKAMLQEASKLCDTKESLLVAFHVSAECPGLLPQDEAKTCRNAISNEAPEVLCSKMKELAFVLGELLDMDFPSKKGFLVQAGFEESRILMASRASPTEQTSRCESARLQCNNSIACGRHMSALGRGSVEALAASLQLCSESAAAMVAAVDVEAECSPSPVAASAIVASLRKHHVTDASSCELALNALEVAEASASAPDAEQCAAAQMKCASDSRCRNVALELSSIGNIAGSSSSVRGGDALTAATRILELCENSEVMVMAIDVGSSCSGPLQALEMELLKTSAKASEARDVCAQIADASSALMRQVHAWDSSEVLPLSKDHVAKVMLPTIVKRASERLAFAVDVAPQDKRLNPLELMVLQRLVKVAPEGSTLKRMGPQHATVGLAEVVAMLQPRLQPQLEKLLEEL